jgi:hypothetical protein
MDSSLSFLGFRAGFDSFTGFEEARRFLGGSDWASGRFRFFWEEGMVKKDDMVVVSAQEQRVVGDGKQLELFQKMLFCLAGKAEVVASGKVQS